ncbi:ABC transporter ATP-binding protein [Paraburkholderia oxyphila]|uniref:ABC transporter ATP-binding protein n=1 Tax=Paraburkholderia oxyphila TaxID=614212 RepID=UPI00048394E7|nr:ABC transporter ATP-binding protein [Paraburkholderia oxyphila]
MSKLILRSIAKRFGEALAVDHLDLALAEGEFIALLGPSGCGKTTTLRMIAGFTGPDGGTIEMDGCVLSSASAVVPPERRHMSMIFQSYAVWPNMTVEENVAFGLNLRRLPREDVRTRVGEMLDVVRLAHLAQRYPAELSGGQQQRVALARAIVIRPSVLLLDEPLSNLDAYLREEMRFEIRKLHDEFHITTIYVTHDQSEAMMTADRIAVMNQGRLEQVDDPHTLYTRPKTRFVARFVGRTNFVEGSCQGDEIVFDRFSVPRWALPGGPALTGEVTFSVRPHTLRLSREALHGMGSGPRVAVRIVQRAYLGEYWDYSATPVEGSTRLHVNAPPSDRYEVGEVLWLEFDPAQMAAVA